MFLHQKANNAEQEKTAATARTQQRRERKTTTASNEGFITEEGGFVVCVHLYECALIVTRNKLKQTFRWINRGNKTP